MTEGNSVLGPDGAPAARDFSCPHCGSKNPPFDFLWNGGGNLQMRVSFVTIVCAGEVTVLMSDMCEKKIPCRRILGVSVVDIQAHVPGGPLR